MGWQSDRHGLDHEGGLVGVIEERGHLRELSYPGDSEIPPQHVTVVQVGCSCGWRSQRLRAPTGTLWHPFSVTLPERERASASPGLPTFEDRAAALWEEHCSSPLLRAVVP